MREAERMGAARAQRRAFTCVVTEVRFLPVRSDRTIMLVCSLCVASPILTMYVSNTLSSH